MWNDGRLDYSGLAKLFPRALKDEYVAKGTEKCKILGSLLDKELEDLEDHGYPKVQDLVDEKMIEFPTQTQDVTSLCGARGKMVLVTG